MNIHSINYSNYDHTNPFFSIEIACIYWRKENDDAQLKLYANRLQFLKGVESSLCLNQDSIFKAKKLPG